MSQLLFQQVPQSIACMLKWFFTKKCECCRFDPGTIPWELAGFSVAEIERKRLLSGHNASINYDGSTVGSLKRIDCPYVDRGYQGSFF